MAYQATEYAILLHNIIYMRVPRLSQAIIFIVVTLVSHLNYFQHLILPDFLLMNTIHESAIIWNCAMCEKSASLLNATLTCCQWLNYKILSSISKARKKKTVITVFTAWFTGFRWSHGFLKVCCDFTVLSFFPHKHIFVNTNSGKVSTLIVAERKLGRQKKKKKKMFHVEDTVYKLRRVSFKKPSGKVPANALLLLICAPFSIKILTTACSLCRSFISILDFWSR